MTLLLARPEEQHTGQGYTEAGDNGKPGVDVRFSLDTKERSDGNSETGKGQDQAQFVHGARTLTREDIRSKGLVTLFRTVPSE